MVAEVPYELQDREMSLQAVKLQESGADVLVLFSTTTHGANVVKEIARLGQHPLLYASFTLADHHVMFRLLGELWEGAYFNTYVPLVGSPGTERILAPLLAKDASLKGREGFATLGALEMMLDGGGAPAGGKGPDPRVVRGRARGPARLDAGRRHGPGDLRPRAPPRAQLAAPGKGGQGRRPLLHRLDRGPELSPALLTER